MKAVPGVLPETLEFIKLWRYDQLLEKHEGPENWAAAIHWEGAAVFEHEGTRLLLPREPDRIPNISVLRWIPSADGAVVTAYLKDVTLAEEFGPDDEWMWAGFVAICELVPTEPLYVATFYHQWLMFDNANPHPGQADWLRKLGYIE